MMSIDNIVRRAEWSEKAIERYLVEQVTAHGGECLKYFNMHQVGYPDRIVMLPSGWAAWVELKSHDKKPTQMQRLRHDRLRRLGQTVYVIDTRQGVDALLNDWRAKQ